MLPSTHKRADTVSSGFRMLEDYQGQPRIVTRSAVVGMLHCACGWCEDKYISESGVVTCSECGRRYVYCNVLELVEVEGAE